MLNLYVPLAICVIVWEKVPHVAQKLNYIISIDSCSLDSTIRYTLQNGDIFKIVDFILKCLLTSDGKSKLII